MKMKKNFETQSVVISASAGTGKTYQLSLRYIGLLALGTPAHEIIALTFTKKAAGEFRSRILRDLAIAASSEEAAEEMRKKIQLTLQGAESQHGLLVNAKDYDQIDSLTRYRFQELLMQVVHELDRLNLGTLDSFFGKLVSALSLELGISSISIIDQSYNKLIQDSVIKAMSWNQEERESILQQFFNNLVGENSGDFVQVVERFVDKYHTMFTQLPDMKDWGDLNTFCDEKTWRDVDASMQSAKKAYDYILDLNNQLEEDRLPGFERRVKTSLSKSFVAFSHLYSIGKFNASVSSAFKPESVFWTSKENKGEYGVEMWNNFYKFSDEIGEKIYKSFKVLIKYAYLRNVLQLKTIYKFIKQYDEFYEKKIRSVGKYTFDDITQMLLPKNNMGKTSRQERLENLRYRMDGWYKHWLLDEFQDTSLNQWNILKEFIDEVAQSNEDKSRSVFIVGDTKQSIYSFRGGDSRIFDRLTSDEPWKSTFGTPWQMSVSYRSAPVIMDFVNRVFQYDFEAICDSRWKFQLHSSAPYLAEKKGNVCVWELKKGEKAKKSVTALLQKVLPLERKLTCAILVETNEQARQYAQWLRSDEGGNFNVEVDAAVSMGEDSPIGSLLMDFFRWLNHPEDKYAESHLADSYFSLIMPKKKWSENYQFWWELYENRGLAGVITEIRRLLNRTASIPPLSEFNDERMRVWHSKAEDFDVEGGFLNDFIQMMENSLQNLHSTSSSIQVMTYHKSKGLEFDIVLMPDLSGTSVSNLLHLTFLQAKDKWGNLSGFIPYFGEDLISYDTKMQGFVKSWKDEQNYDAICKLYVSLTRAKRGLYLFLPLPNANTDQISLSSLIRKGIGEEQDKKNKSNILDLSDTISSCLFNSGEYLWFEELPLCEINSHESLCSDKELRTPQKKVKYTSPSSLSHVSSKGNADSTYSEGALFGKIAHSLLEKIEWEDSIDVVLKSYKAHTDLEKCALIKVKECLQNNTFRSIFIKPESSAILYREQPVCGVTKSGNQVFGVVDRAVLSKGILTIIDYKTDGDKSEGELVETYQPQLSCYAELLSHSLGIDRDHVRTEIASLKLEKIISCSLI